MRKENRHNLKSAIVLQVFLGLCLTAPAFSQNLLSGVNSGFEETGPWEKTGTAGSILRSGTTAQANSGWSVGFQNPTTLYADRGVKSSTVSVAAGNTYTARAWFFVQNEAGVVSDSQGQIIVGWYNATNVFISSNTSADITLTAFDTWEQKSTATITAPISAVTARISIRVKESVNNNNDIFTDNLRFEDDMAPSTNLLAALNPGFEDDGVFNSEAAFWESIGTASSILRSGTTAQANSSWSMQFGNPTTAYTGRGVKSAAVSVTVGKSYVARTWFFVQNEGTGAIGDSQARMQLEWLDAADALIQTDGAVDQTLATFDTWEQLATTGHTAPVGAVTAKVYVSVKESVNNDNDIFVDNVELEEGEAEIVDVTTRSAVINELAWAGTAASHNHEWIELFNNTTNTINLTGWTLQANDGSPNITLTGSVSAGSFFLLARSVSGVSAISDVAVDQSYTGNSLGNSGEDLVLRDANSITVDEVLFLTSGWPGGTTSPDYLTMERKDPTADGKAAVNWGSNNRTTRNGLDANGNALNGTPRAQNSIFSEIIGGTENCTNLVDDDGDGLTDCDDPDCSTNTACVAVSTTTVTNETVTVDDTRNPFSPYDSSANLRAGLIYFNVGNASAVKTIRIVDIRGETVRMLINNDVGPANTSVAGAAGGSVQWDGRDDGGNIVPVGIYIVFLEAVDPGTGERIIGKDTIVLGRPF